MTATPGTLFIFVGPEGPDGEAVCSLLGGWARAELVRPCYWLTPQDEGVGVVKARRMDASGISTVSLPDDFATTEWDDCRLVLVQLLAPEVDHDPSVGPFADWYAGLLHRKLLGPNTRLLCINALVPTSNATIAAPDVLLPGWDQTVVVSPEERITPEHANVLVLFDRNLHGHAAVAVASAAGLWIGMNGTPLGGPASESGSGEPAPRLLRTFVRAVLGGDVTQAVADAALTPPQGGWRVPEREGRALGSSPNPRQLVEETVGRIKDIDNGAFTYEPAPLAAGASKGRVGWSAIWNNFKEFCSIFFEGFKDIPSRIRAAAEKRVNDRFFGPDGGTTFGFDVTEADERAAKVIELRKEFSDRPDGTIAGQLARADRTLAVLGRTSGSESASAVAWSELRGLCLGMIDGGPLPAGLEPAIDEPIRMIITDPAHIVPNSELPRWSVPSEICAADRSLHPYRDLTLRPCDPLMTFCVNRDVVSVRDPMRDQARDEAALADQKEAEAATLLQDAAAAVEADQDGSEFIRQSKQATTDAKAARDRQNKLQAWDDRLTAAIDDLETWARPRSDTLFWRVGDELGDALHQATDDLLAAEGVIKPAVELDTESVQLARVRARREVWGGLAAAVAVSLVGRLLLDWRPAPIVGLFVFLLVVLASFSRYSRLKSEVEWRYQEAMATQMNALDRLTHAAREVSRLSILYGFYLDWAEIVGFEAHRPWASAAPAAPGPVVEIERRLLPPAFVVGRSEVSPENLGALGAVAARDIQGEGWLSTAYHDARDFAMARKARFEGRSPDDLDPDTDSPNTPSGARQFLLDEMHSHRPQEAAYRVAAEGIAQFCAGLEPDRIFTEVSVGDDPAEQVNAFLSALTPRTERKSPSFLVDLLTPEAALKGFADEVTVHAWAPKGIGASGVVHTVAVPTTSSGQYVLSAVRIDLGRELAPADLRMFAAGEVLRAVPPITDDGVEW